MQLSQQQIDSFNDRGVLKLSIGLSDEFIDAIVSQVTPMYNQQSFEQRQPGVRIQDGWRHIDEVRRLATNENVLAALKQLFGRAALPFQTLNFPIGTGQLAHSDTLHFNSIPASFMVGVWVAMEDIDEDNGPLIYYPGSHKLKEYSMESFGLEAGYHNYARYEQAIQGVLAQHKLEPELGIAKKGDIIIWHANLLHGGAPQKDRARTRHSQVTHYFFENCQYYTPMNSSPTKKEMRKPQWIPDKPITGLASIEQKSAYRRIRMALGKLRRGRNPFRD
jgi:hypothetical protein